MEALDRITEWVKVAVRKISAHSKIKIKKKFQANAYKFFKRTHNFVRRPWSKNNQKVSSFRNEDFLKTFHANFAYS